MKWTAYGEAFAHDRHVVMGRELRPFCLYYRLWLRIIGSPFAGVNREVTAADVEMASRICSCRFGEAEKSLRQRFGRAEKWWRAMKLLRKDALKNEVEKMLAYLDDTATGPDYAPEGGGDKEEFPSEVMGVAVLMKEGGMSREEAWMLPYGEGAWMREAFGMLAGADRRALSEHEKDLLDRTMAAEARKEARWRKSLDEWNDERAWKEMLGDVEP